MPSTRRVRKHKNTKAPRPSRRTGLALRGRAVRVVLSLSPLGSEPWSAPAIRSSLESAGSADRFTELPFARRRWVSEASIGTAGPPEGSPAVRVHRGRCSQRTNHRAARNDVAAGAARSFRRAWHRGASLSTEPVPAAVHACCRSCRHRGVDAATASRLGRSGCHACRCRWLAVTIAPQVKRVKSLRHIPRVIPAIRPKSPGGRR